MPETSKIQGTPYLNGPVLAAVRTGIAAQAPVRVDDSALIREAQQGNTAAFEELVRQYDRAVLRLAVHLTGSQEDGQDIYQEAFLRAYINLSRFRFECSFYTWIYRIVTNLCLDHLRKKRSRGRDLVAAMSPDGEQEDVLDRMPDRSPGASPERSFAGRELKAMHRKRLETAITAGTNGLRAEALPRLAATDRCRNAQYDGRYDQEHVVPRHSQTADPAR